MFSILSDRSLVNAVSNLLFTLFNIPPQALVVAHRLESQELIRRKDSACALSKRIPIHIG